MLPLQACYECAVCPAYKYTPSEQTKRDMTNEKIKHFPENKCNFKGSLVGRHAKFMSKFFHKVCRQHRANMWRRQLTDIEECQVHWRMIIFFLSTEKVQFVKITQAKFTAKGNFPEEMSMDFQILCCLFLNEDIVKIKSNSCTKHTSKFS